MVHDIPFLIAIVYKAYLKKETYMVRSFFMKRIFYYMVGFLCLCIGSIGIVIPILPTTPFFIISATCFGATSPRLYSWLLQTKYFGEFIRSYKERTPIATKTRVIALCWLWGALLLSSFFVQKTVVLLILLGIGISVSAHILLLRRKISYKHYTKVIKNNE